MRPSLRPLNAIAQVNLLSGDDYANLVLATVPLAFWQSNEGTGSAIVDSSGNGFNGTYTGVTWDGTTGPKGGLAPFYDATNDYGDVHSAGLGTAFDYDEFTIITWIKVNAEAVWTDGAIRGFVRLGRDAIVENDIRIQKSATNNTVRFLREGANVVQVVDVAGQSDTDWVAYGISCSIAGGGLLDAGDLRGYKNGVQIGSTVTGNVAADGSGLLSTLTLLGALSTAPSNVHHGYQVLTGVWNRPMAADILALMT